MAGNNTESMKDFEKELESSFKVIKEGDILNVTVIGISETELTVDLNYYTEVSFLSKNVVMTLLFPSKTTAISAIPFVQW